jgi:hypothetical protein
VRIVGMSEIQLARQGTKKFPAKSRREFASASGRMWSNRLCQNDERRFRDKYDAWRRALCFCAG